VRKARAPQEAREQLGRERIAGRGAVLGKVAARGRSRLAAHRGRRHRGRLRVGRRGLAFCERRRAALGPDGGQRGGDERRVARALDGA
jgi:hypothetical protein